MEVASLNLDRKWMILAAVGLMQIMGCIDLTAINLAVAPIANEFHATISSAEWIIIVMQIIPASLMVIAGKYSDFYGKKRIFILGVLIFTFASLFAGLARSTESLILFRAFQGLGLALEFPVAYAIIFSAFPQQQKGLAFGLMVTIASVAKAFGPVFGGFMVHIASWRWIFLINLPLGALAVLIMFLMYPSDSKNEKQHINYISAGLFGFGLVFMIFALNKTSNHAHFGLINFWLIMSIGILLLILFVFNEKKSKKPLVGQEIIGNKMYLGAIFIRVMFCFIFLGLLFELSLYLQNVLNNSTLLTGIALLSMTVVSALISPFAGKIIDRAGAKLPIIIGTFSLFFCCVILALLPVSPNLIYFILPLALFGISVGFIIPATATFALQSVAPENTGIASGFMTTLGFGASSLGVAVIGLLTSSLSVDKFSYLIKNSGINSLYNKIFGLINIVQGTRSVNYFHEHLSAAITEKITVLVQSAFKFGFSISMWLSVIIMGISILLAFKLAKNNLDV